MTTTPTIWKAPFRPNAASAQGHQSVSQTVGLTNGNFLVVWEDDTQGPGPFIDIMGRLYSAEGRPLGGVFQVNSSVTASDETGPKIVALPDGGYVVTYGGYFEATGGFINVERFDSAGNSVFNSQILDERSSLNCLGDHGGQHR